ncbi:MAG: ferredoxin domain-containing protein, partial [Proteobacteria bacterium]|nr:ferredoxin domain-containing protein [Pseudomonadota bacterium]
SSAVKIASILNADNRIYYRIGAAVRRLRYLPEASVIMGIPLSATGKNPHFDRERR